jgi:hypothetical protein
MLRSDIQSGLHPTLFGLKQVLGKVLGVCLTLRGLGQQAPSPDTKRVSNNLWAIMLLSSLRVGFIPDTMWALASCLSYRAHLNIIRLNVHLNPC